MAKIQDSLSRIIKAIKITYNWFKGSKWFKIFNVSAKVITKLLSVGFPTANPNLLEMNIWIKWGERIQIF